MPVPEVIVTKEVVIERQEAGDVGRFASSIPRVCHATWMV